MSQDINVFVENIDDLIISAWLDELNKLDMTCEVHPEFSFNDHSGFLPFKINVHNGLRDEHMNETYLTGFELYVDDFDLQEYLEPTQKQSWLDKLLKKPVKKSYFASPEIDKKLAKCNKVITFNWGSSDTFEYRMASLASATLAKVTDGISCYPADEIWYNTETVVEDSLKEVHEYEGSLKTTEFRLHKFEEWL